ncbi:unnamed protein product [Nezara viridula]|uniref:Uncharacterized protein n=1 Tax=Nezara viridula TaxID=85310 RepID=A0A9P0EDY2_NEZVI|nr:unnamed protein product [Nezara viridula]
MLRRSQHSPGRSSHGPGRPCVTISWIQDVAALSSSARSEKEKDKTCEPASKRLSSKETRVRRWMEEVKVEMRITSKKVPRERCYKLETHHQPFSNNASGISHPELERAAPQSLKYLAGRLPDGDIDTFWSPF